MYEVKTSVIIGLYMWVCCIAALQLRIHIHVHIESNPCRVSRQLMTCAVADDIGLLFNPQINLRHSLYTVSFIGISSEMHLRRHSAQSRPRARRYKWTGIGAYANCRPSWINYSLAFQIRCVPSTETGGAETLWKGGGQPLLNHDDWQLSSWWSPLHQSRINSSCANAGQSWGWLR